MDEEPAHSLWRIWIMARMRSAKQKLKDNKDTVIRQEDIVNRLKAIREELNKLKEAFDALQPGNE